MRFLSMPCWHQPTMAECTHYASHHISLKMTAGCRHNRFPCLIGRIVTPRFPNNLLLIIKICSCLRSDFATSSVIYSISSLIMGRYCLFIINFYYSSMGGTNDSIRSCLPQAISIIINTLEA